MSVKAYSVTLALILLPTTWGLGQQADRNVQAPPPGEVPAGIQEDIAVFRVLLDRALSRHYGLPASDRAHGFHQPLQVEGVYLAGHGVVFSLSAPPTADPLGKPQAAAKPISDWERVQLELRGEKVTEETRKETVKKPLGDVVLELLIENGPRFKKLAAAERLTVALTFRSGQDCLKCHAAGTAFWSSSTRTPNTNLPTPLARYSHSGQQAGLFAPSSGQTLTVPAQGPLYPELPSDQLTGDLLLKQGKYAEAEQSYGRALKKLMEYKAEDEKVTPKLRRYLLIGELTSKIGQCHLALGQTDKAKAMMDASRRITEQASKLLDEQKGGGGTLPTQLVVSATKQQLIDQGPMSANKVSAEAFRKIASVELRTPETKPEK